MRYNDNLAGGILPGAEDGKPVGLDGVMCKILAPGLRYPVMIVFNNRHLDRSSDEVPSWSAGRVWSMLRIQQTPDKMAEHCPGFCLQQNS